MHATGVDSVIAPNRPLGERHFPASDRWAKGLARIYLHDDANEKLLPVLTKLANLEPDSITLRKKLAELAAAAKDFTQVRSWATQIIHLDLQDADGHALLAAAAMGLKEFGLAREEYKTALELAEALLATGRANGGTTRRRPGGKVERVFLRPGSDGLRLGFPQPAGYDHRSRG